MWMIGVALILGAVGLVMNYFSQKRKLEQMEATETSTVEFLESLRKSMAEGVGAGSLNYVTEVKGKIVCDEPIVSELAGVECVFYSMTVTREYEEAYYERDQQGRTHRRIRTGYDPVASNQRSTPFYVQDATGRIRIRPDGAEFVGEEVHSRFESAEQHGGGFLQIGRMRIELPRSYSGGDRRTIGYHFEEEAVPVGSEVYVLGEATDREGELCIVRPMDKDKKLIVSTRSEEELARQGQSSMKISVFGAIACIILGIAAIVYDLMQQQ